MPLVLYRREVSSLGKVPLQVLVGHRELWEREEGSRFAPSGLSQLCKQSSENHRMFTTGNWAKRACKHEPGNKPEGAARAVAAVKDL